jgi:hypothetical protein
VSTKSLPANGTIANVSFTQNGDTVIYKVDVLVPYAFVQLFISIKEKHGFVIGKHGWLIDMGYYKGRGLLYIANYLVEGNDFYSGFCKYTGTWGAESKTNIEWSWSSIGVAPQSQSGYMYMWNVPLAGTDATASEYLI